MGSEHDGDGIAGGDQILRMMNRDFVGFEAREARWIPPDGFAAGALGDHGVSHSHRSRPDGQEEKQRAFGGDVALRARRARPHREHARTDYAGDEPARAASPHQ